jgi:hypothetical protein
MTQLTASNQETPSARHSSPRRHRCRAMRVVEALTTVEGIRNSWSSETHGDASEGGASRVSCAALAAKTHWAPDVARQRQRRPPSRPLLKSSSSATAPSCARKTPARKTWSVSLTPRSETETFRRSDAVTLPASRPCCGRARNLSWPIGCSRAERRIPSAPSRGRSSPTA